MSVSFLIGSFGDLPFEKILKIYHTFPRVVPRHNEWTECRYGARGECDFDAGIGEEVDCASRGGNSMPKEADIAPPHAMYGVALRRGRPPR